jgi:hypothetical protein
LRLLESVWQPCSVAEALATYFKSVCNNHCMHDFSTNFWSSDSLPIASISDSDVRKAKGRTHQNLLALMALLYLLWRVVLIF